MRCAFARVFGLREQRTGRGSMQSHVDNDEQRCKREACHAAALRRANVHYTCPNSFVLCVGTCAVACDACVRLVVGDCMDVQAYGRLGVQACGRVAVSASGRLIAWASVVWASGGVAFSACEHLAVCLWACGRVGVCTYVHMRWLIVRSARPHNGVLHVRWPGQGGPTATAAAPTACQFTKRTELPSGPLWGKLLHRCR